MAAFESSFAKTSINEGGYANNPGDHGGETYRGIARNYWPAWKGWLIIDAAKADGKQPNSIKSKPLDQLVSDFYLGNFWAVLAAGQITAQEVADELFDTAVNMGISRAARFLQDALTILGEKVAIDGKVGPATIAAANRVNPVLLVRILNILQGARYLDIVRADPSQRTFLNNWLNRSTMPIQPKKTAIELPKEVANEGAING